MLDDGRGVNNIEAVIGERIWEVRRNLNISDGREMTLNRDILRGQAGRRYPGSVRVEPVKIVDLSIVYAEVQDVPGWFRWKVMGE